MRAIEIARQFADHGQTEDACQAYRVAIHESGGADPAAEMEAAIYILQSGGDYKVSYSRFVDLHRRGCFQEDCLSIMTEAFYTPNVKNLRSRYERNCKLLSKYPYLFRRDFPEFDDLPIRFYPFDDKSYTPYDTRAGRFGDYINFTKPVVSRNFFKDLEKPVLAGDVFSQYELEYLNDNVRKSEYVGRENHIYLHYSDWDAFCSYLQCLNMRPLLVDKKVVFLIQDELEQYPIDFNARFGIDYSRFSIKRVGIREVNRLIWHTQLASHNGGDFFNEIFDAHPNLLAMPSLFFSNVEETVAEIRTTLNESVNVRDAVRRMGGWDPRLVEELYLLRNRTEKDVLVALFLRENLIFEKDHEPTLDRASRIAPALFFQPHFRNIIYRLRIDRTNRTTLESEEYEKVCTSALFRSFKYIKTFTPMRRITTSYGATVRFMWKQIEKTEDGKTAALMPDTLSQRVLNRSFMIDWQDRLYADCVLVRFEDAKLNPKATFSALAAFLDLPYTQSMTYCSLHGEIDPESLAGNDLGFSLGAVYRTYDDFANDIERAYIEYFMRDAYEFYGYDFKYYDGRPVDAAQAKNWIADFSTLDHYIQESLQLVCEKLEVTNNGKTLTGQEREHFIEQNQTQILEGRIRSYAENRLKNSNLLLRGLRFVNRKGQPLHMMPKLELDPALLEQPLYH